MMNVCKNYSGARHSKDLTGLLYEKNLLPTVQWIWVEVLS